MQRLALIPLLAFTLTHCGQRTRERETPKEVTPAADYASCSTLRVTRFIRTTSGGKHSLSASVQNDGPTLKGFALGYFQLKSDSELMLSESQPSLLMAGGSATFFIASSDTPFAATDAALAPRVRFTECPNYESRDLLFVAKGGITYTFQRSVDLVNWQNLGSVTFADDTTVWRSYTGRLRPNANEPRAFFRAAGDLGDDASEATRLAENERLLQTAIKLREAYGITPKPKPAN